MNNFAKVFQQGVCVIKPEYRPHPEEALLMQVAYSKLDPKQVSGYFLRWTATHRIALEEASEYLSAIVDQYTDGDGRIDEESLENDEEYKRIYAYFASHRAWFDDTLDYLLYDTGCNAEKTDKLCYILSMIDEFARLKINRTEEVSQG